MIATTSSDEEVKAKAIGLLLSGISENSFRPLPPSPTRALPGSEEKIRVMTWRQSRGFHLHHPWDAKFADDPRIVLRQIMRDLDNRPIHPNEIPDERTITQKAIDEAEGDLPWSIEEV